VDPAAVTVRADGKGVESACLRQWGEGARRQGRAGGGAARPHCADLVPQDHALERAGRGLLLALHPRVCDSYTTVADSGGGWYWRGTLVCVVRMQRLLIGYAQWPLRVLLRIAHCLELDFDPDL